MMRSMFTGVSGLRVHQTRMDVIANNVANVNTVGFKSARATFRDSFYQNLSGATAANPEVGRTGMNPQQVGLGLSMGSIDNIMTQGISQRTDFGMDIMIQNEGMFIVTDARGTFFTRAGNVAQDARGNLGINGMQLMGWDVVENETTGAWEVNRSNLVPLSMSGAKANMPSEPTTVLELAGNLNIRDLTNPIRFEALPAGETFNAARPYRIPATDPRVGEIMTGHITRSMTIFDSMGHNYVVDVRFTYHNVQGGAHNYWTYEFVGTELPAEAGPPATPAQFVVNAWRDGIRSTTANPVAPARLAIHTGPLTHGLTGTPAAGTPPGTIAGTPPVMTVNTQLMNPGGTLAFNSLGELVAIGPAERSITDSGTPDVRQAFAPVQRTGTPQAILDAGWRNVSEMGFEMHIVPVRGTTPRATFGDTSDTNRVLRYDGAGNAVHTPVGTITFQMAGLFNRGGMNTNAAFEPINGNPPGTLRDISFGNDGTITGLFTNGRIRILGQVPVAVFANPPGLQRLGNNLWQATANSGSFDGIGVIGDIQSGALEMSNVDLAESFTDMIVTQRGFQASSRLITVSDEMIQELVNLRR